MNRNQVQVRQNPYGYRNFGGYPALGPGGYPPESYGYSMPQPYAQQIPASPGSGGSGLLGGFNLTDIKSVIDRMGGIDGVLATMGKVQKIVSSLQQMQPMLKLLVNMLPGKAKTADVEDALENWKRPRRRKRRKGKKKAYARSALYSSSAKRNRRGY